MLYQVKSFKELFKELFQKGVPYFLDEYSKLIYQYEYQALLVKVRLDHRKFKDMTQSLTGKAIIDKLAMDFEILDSFKMIGANIPPISYVDHVDLRVLDKEMENLEVPCGEKWKTIEKFEK